MADSEDRALIPSYPHIFLLSEIVCADCSGTEKVTYTLCRPCSVFVVAFWFLFRCQILEGRNRYAVTHPGVLIFLVSDWSTLLSSDWVQLDQ